MNYESTTDGLINFFISYILQEPLQRFLKLQHSPLEILMEFLFCRIPNINIITSSALYITIFDDNTNWNGHGLDQFVIL